MKGSARSIKFDVALVPVAFVVLFLRYTLTMRVRSLIALVSLCSALLLLQSPTTTATTTAAAAAAAAAEAEAASRRSSLVAFAVAEDVDEVCVCALLLRWHGMRRTCTSEVPRHQP